MKVVKRVIEYLIAIAVIPAIALIVKSVTELKDVRNVSYELLSEEDGVYNITPGTYEKLMENKRIKNYELESNYPLITQEEMDRATWEYGDLKNEIYIDEFGQKRIILNVGKVTFDGSEDWRVANPYDDVIRFILYGGVDNTKAITVDNNNGISNYFPVIVTHNNNNEGFQVQEAGNIYVNISKDKLPSLNADGFKRWLQDRYNEGNPFTIWYVLDVKDPNSIVIESRDLSITSDYVRLTKPYDFSNNPDGLRITELINSIDRFEVTENWIYVYPRGITVEELASRMVGTTLIYELAQPRPVEVYDFSKFRLVFDKKRIRVVFDVDDEYYLWEITQDDKMIPINGQYDLGNIWTVKFYVYEIQQPLIRNLVLLIPLIVVSGLLLYMMKKKDISL